MVTNLTLFFIVEGSRTSQDSRYDSRFLSLAVNVNFSPRECRFYAIYLGSSQPIS
jgi:hypothetical protein